MNMKTLRIAAVLAVLLCMSGCTVTKAFQDTPAPTFPSAGKEVIIGTKKTTEEIRKEVEKTVADTAKKQEEQEKKETSKETKTAVAAEPSVPEKKTQSEPVPEQYTAPKATPVPEPDPEPVPVPQPIPEPEPVPVPVPTPEPEPTPPPQACPGGKNPDLGCEVILDTNYYRETFGSYNDAMARGQYYMDEVMYIGDIEITSYSVQEVYRNDHSIAYYGLNLWSNGSLIQ
jgi:hypothetical protein